MINTAFKKILIIGIACLIGISIKNHLYGYIFGVHELTNNNSGQRVILCYDKHKLGTQQQSDDQFNFFASSILPKLNNTHLLIESPFFYNYSINDAQNLKKITTDINNIMCPLDWWFSGDPHPSPSPFMGWKLPLLIMKANKNNLKLPDNFTIASIDPRYEKHYTHAALSDAPDLLSMLYAKIVHNDTAKKTYSLQTFIDTVDQLYTTTLTSIAHLKNPTLTNQMVRIGNKIINNHADLIKAFQADCYKNLGSYDTAYIQTPIVTLQKSISSFNQTMQFLSSPDSYDLLVDLVTLAAIATSPHRTVVVMCGGFHARNLASHLEQLNFCTTHAPADPYGISSNLTNQRIAAVQQEFSTIFNDNTAAKTSLAR